MLNKEEKLDWEMLCEECSSATKEAGLTKEDSRKILEEYRIMERKAIMYDELIDRLEKDVVNITKTMQDGKHSDYYSRCRLKAYRTKTKEILSFLKGEKHE